jgi:hypothetical protein
LHLAKRARQIAERRLFLRLELSNEQQSQRERRNGMYEDTHGYKLAANGS